MFAVGQQTTTLAASTLLVRSPVRIGVQCQFLDKPLKLKTDLARALPVKYLAILLAATCQLM